MKIGVQILILAISTITLVTYGQGRGMINRIERNKVIAIVSCLKPELAEADTIKFLLLDRGLNWDWGASGIYPTNHTEMWYRFGTTNIEELRLEFRPKQHNQGADWQKYRGTNTFFFKAQIYRLEKAGLAELWSTNASDYTIRTNR